jgi:hypothetical protein
MIFPLLFARFCDTLIKLRHKVRLLAMRSKIILTSKTQFAMEGHFCDTAFLRRSV